MNPLTPTLHTHFGRLGEVAMGTAGQSLPEGKQIKYWRRSVREVKSFSRLNLTIRIHNQTRCHFVALLYKIRVSKLFRLNGTTLFKTKKNNYGFVCVSALRLAGDLSRVYPFLDSCHRLQQNPATQVWIKQVQKMNGWMELKASCIYFGIPAEIQNSERFSSSIKRYF